MNVAFNMDCVEGMKQYPDGYFDLAVVDPVYGDVPYGGYMSNTGGGVAGHAGLFGIKIARKVYIMPTVNWHGQTFIGQPEFLDIGGTVLFRRI